MAIAAVAALASAGGVAAGLVTVSTLSMISAVVTVVGMATGNKELSQLGAGMGVGAAGAGILGLGSSAAGASTAAAAGESANVAADAVQGGVGGATEGLSATQQAADTGLNGLGDRAVSTVDITGQAGQAAPLATQTSQAADAAIQAQPSGLMAQPDSGIATPDAPIGAQAPEGVTSPSSPADEFANETDKFARQQNSVGGTPTGIQDSATFWSKFSNWTNQNKTLTSGIMQLGGSALSGIAKSNEADRTYQLGQQKLAIQQQQLANGSAQPIINLKPKYTGMMA